jgi:hypothetical protein
MFKKRILSWPKDDIVTKTRKQVSPEEVLLLQKTNAYTFWERFYILQF